MSKVLRILALIAFVIAVFHVNIKVDPVALGLLFWVGSTLV
jgi:hypothetical protein